MIRCQFTLRDGSYTKLFVKGHAESGEYGKDLVCAGVSSIVFGLMNACDACGDITDIRPGRNKIEIEVLSESGVIQNYFELAYIQLRTIEESHGEYIQVERK